MIIPFSVVGIEALEEQISLGQGETDKAVQTVKGLKKDLEQADAARLSLQSQVDGLNDRAGKLAGALGLLAAGGGIYGALSKALEDGDGDEVKKSLAAIEAAKVDQTSVEYRLNAEQAAVHQLSYELEQARNAQAAIQREFEAILAVYEAAHDRVGIVAAATGPIGVVGAALESGDEVELRAAIAAANAEYARQPRIIEVQAAAPEALVDARTQLARLTALQEALQMQVDALNAQAVATASRIGLVTGTGGLLEPLGRALASGDEAGVVSSVNAIQTGLSKAAPSAQAKG
ncbi:MAG: hypothetical protein IPK16_31380 [Anaerolineales bacterium]|nr:hypothetical protein [Anaerolineales bacterium]